MAFDEAAPNHPLVVAGARRHRRRQAAIPSCATPTKAPAKSLYGSRAGGGRQGDELASLIYLRLSLALAPDNTLATVTLADLYERLKQEEAAIDLYRQRARSRPVARQRRRAGVVLLETLGKTKEASDRCGDRRRPSQGPGRLTALGQSSALAQGFSRTPPRPIRARWPCSRSRKGPVAAVLLSRHRQRTGASIGRSAEADFKKALELYPDQPLVLNYLGYSWVDQGVNLDEAFKMLRRAVDLRARDGYIVDSLGWAYYRLGRYDEATDELEKAIDLKPSDPVVNDHLGDAYWRVGRKLEAHFQWNHARDLGADPEDLPRILDKIKNGLSDQPAVAGDKASNKGG